MVRPRGLIPSTHVTCQVWQSAFIPVLGDRDRRVLGFNWPASLVDTSGVRFRKRHCLKNERRYARDSWHWLVACSIVVFSLVWLLAPLSGVWVYVLIIILPGSPGLTSLGPSAVLPLNRTCQAPSSLTPRNLCNQILHLTYGRPSFLIKSYNLKFL